MRNALLSSAVLAWSIVHAVPAAAQRLSFERTFDVAGPVTLDVSTIRGRIDVLAGEGNRVVVSGTVTVRIGLTAPADALAIAQRIATSPPIEQDQDTIRLRPPADAGDQRAVTVAYQVRVPPASTVRTNSGSGETLVRGISGAVAVRTRSANVELDSLGGSAAVATGSGAVAVDGVAGMLTVETASSSITARRLGSSLRLRTQSGEVEAAWSGTGDADVETGSSAVRLSGLRGGATVTSRSGRISVEGDPGRDWTLTTGSSNVEAIVSASAALQLEATSGSSNVRVIHPAFKGTSGKGKASGAIGAGRPLVRISSRSGQILVRGG